MKTHHKIIIGDSRKVLINIPRNSIPFIFFSPPYWNRKDYNHENQIGFGQTYEKYIDDLYKIIWQCERVLIPGRKLCINIGDLYLDSKNFNRYRVLSIKSDLITFCNYNTHLDYLGAIIWQKVCKTKPSGGINGRFMGSYPRPPNGIITLDYEYILIFKKIGPTPEIPKEIKEQSIIPKKIWEQYFSGHWQVPGDKDNSHPATFPLEIPYRLIRMYSFIGETILDPFLGSGTTMKAARILNRNSIGIEVQKKYLSKIKEKVGFNQKSLFNNCKFEVCLEE